MSQNKENVAFRPARRANGHLSSSTRTPPSEDFFTDSLIDASKIPTPSPRKQHFSPAYRGRRALGNTKTLRAALDNANGGADRRPGSSGYADPLGPQHLKPAIQPKARKSPSPLRPSSGTTTPPQTRQKIEISPTSDVSSPPGGLTDTYQRIADEEDLAAQEGQLEDEDDNTEDITPDLGYGTDEMDHGYRQHLGDLRELDQNVPYSSKDNKENTVADDSISEASGVSFLNQLTDQNLAAKLTPHAIDHARDRERIDRMIRNERPISFSRGHARQLGRLAKDNMQEDGTPGGDQDLKSSSSTAGGRTDRSEPPLNVPRTWGSRARAGKEWIDQNRTRRDKESNGIRSSPGPESSQVDWASAAADVALPSVEDSSTPRARTSRDSSPVSLHRQSSLDRIRQWELNDFTGQSLQVSNSPPVRMRQNVLGQIREKEIERLEQQAVTTNRLGEMRKKDPTELIRRLTRSHSAEAAQTPNGLLQSAEKGKEVKFADQGDAIPDTPIVVYRTNGSQAIDTKPEDAGPNHDRKQSHDRLQRLARAMSNSPRSSTTPEDWSLLEAEQETAATAAVKGDGVQAPQRLEKSRQSSKQVTDVESTPQGAKVADTAKTPVMTGAWTDTILPNTARTTKKPENQTGYSQTPYVSAGGWVDTPLPNGKRQSSALAPMTIEEVPEELTNDIVKSSSEEKAESAAQQVVQASSTTTDASKSALASLLQRAKQKIASQDSNDTLNLGDDTIGSLEDLLTLDEAEMTTLMRMGAEFEARNLCRNGSHDDGQVDEAELLARLGGRLERLRTNIHDARRGISKLEHQVSHPEPGVTFPTTTPLSLTQPCKTCGSPPIYTMHIPLHLPIPRLFHPRHKNTNQWLLRPTLFGWTTIILWLWYLSEQTMCELYCHPLYTDSTYKWPAEPEPVFPWALPTMLWRWSGLRRFLPVVLGPIWTLLVACVRLIGQVLGWSDGFVDDFPKMAPTASQRGPELSMMHDEYI